MNDEERITRHELEENFQILQSDLQSIVADKKTQVRSAITVGGFVLLVGTYLLGRRRGKRHHGIVEIRRG